MDRIDFLFIFRTDGCDPARHRSVIDTPEGNVTTVGVDSVDQACAVAAEALAAGTRTSSSSAGTSARRAAGG